MEVQVLSAAKTRPAKRCPPGEGISATSRPSQDCLYDMKGSVFVATSLDGYLARADGGIDWLEDASGETGEDYGFRRFMSTVDVLVMGRNTFEKVLSFDKWPYGDKPVVVLSSRKAGVPAHLAKTVDPQPDNHTDSRSYRVRHSAFRGTFQGHTTAAHPDAKLPQRTGAKRVRGPPCSNSTTPISVKSVYPFLGNTTII